jgi:hypothetical protein
MTDRDERDVVRAHVERLARDVPPARDLWPQVARGIEASRRRSRRIRAVAAASTLAAAATVALVVGLLDRAGPSREASAPPMPSPAPAPVASLPAPPLPGETDYEGAERILSAELNARRTALEPAQARVLDENLRTVNDAIESTRIAVREHPDDPDLRAELDRVWEDKLDLLRQVTELTSEM